MNYLADTRSLFRPAWFSMVNRETMRPDMIAGLTGAIIVLPQGIAFAIIAGMPPVYGLYTAMVVSVVAAVFGSSVHMVSGPTTAISLALASAVGPMAAAGTEEYVGLALLLTFLTGLIQLVFGVIRLGRVVNFVSHTVVAGFTAGAALLIMNSQLRHIFGLDVQGNGFRETWGSLFSQFFSINWRLPLVAFTALVVAIGIRRINRKLPFMFLGLLASTLLSIFLGGEAAGIPTVGHISSNLPTPSLPHLSITGVQQLLPGAFTVAMLGLIESIAIGKGLGLQTGQRINTNKEFVGQGLANMVGSLFSSYAGSGSFTRSAINLNAGAKTPLAVIFSSLILIILVLFLAPWASYLPKAAMGGIILLVGFGLIDFHEIKEILRCSRLETTVLAITFSSTVFIDLEIAIMLGIISSLVFFLLKLSEPNIAVMAPDPERSNTLTNIIRKDNLKECPAIKIIRIDGPIFYGSLDHIEDFFDHIRAENPDLKHCLVAAEGVNFVGFQGAIWMEQEAIRWKKRGGGLYFANLKIIAQDTLIDGGRKEKIGYNHFYASKLEAIRYIYTQIDPSVCAACKVRVFKECQQADLVEEV